MITILIWLAIPVIAFGLPAVGYVQHILFRLSKSSLFKNCLGLFLIFASLIDMFTFLKTLKKMWNFRKENLQTNVNNVKNGLSSAPLLYDSPTIHSDDDYTYKRESAEDHFYYDIQSRPLPETPPLCHDIEEHDDDSVGPTMTDDIYITKHKCL